MNDLERALLENAEREGVTLDSYLDYLQSEMELLKRQDCELPENARLQSCLQAAMNSARQWQVARSSVQRALERLSAARKVKEAL